MRKITIDPPDSAVWRRWIAACEKAVAEVQASVVRGERPVVSSLYKRKSIKKSFFFSKGPPFYGKCAYCEAPIVDYQNGDTEHFRPKAGVTDEDDRPVLLLDEAGNILLDGEGEALRHPGYYWLAYDWQNLLPACARCNQPAVISGRKVGKHNRFPVEGRHAQKQEEVVAESPLLIHPASGRPEDDPELHLRVDTRTGLMIDKTNRGRACIDILALNLRDQLVADRRRACREVLRLVNEVVQPDTTADAAQEIAEIQAGQRTFSMAQQTTLKEAMGRWQSAFDIRQQ